jgi:hypothetical protein
MKTKHKITGILLVAIFLATMLPVEAVDNQNLALKKIEGIEIKEQKKKVNLDMTDIMAGATKFTKLDTEPVPPDVPEGYPPIGDRYSFVYMTGIYEQYEGVNRLVGVSYHYRLWLEPKKHYANLTGLVSLNIVEGTHAGTHTYPNWKATVNWTGTPHLLPFGIMQGYKWDPSEQKLGFFHCFADYTEDSEHIRYLDRTFVEDWSTPLP